MCPVKRLFEMSSLNIRSQVSVIFFLLCYVHGGPLHASCKIHWWFPAVSCETVAQKIVSQAKAWQTADNCVHGGEKCLYMITEQTARKISGTHTTPVKKYVDDLTFTFSYRNSTACYVEGFSTSEKWYAVLDYGTNYCNLNNLITGSGLNRTQGFVEKTSDSICTQYSKVDCETY